MTRKPSHATRQIFQAFLDAPCDRTYGFELAEATGLPSGTVYPILRRLEEGGFIKSHWEEVETKRQRRRRRYYELTGEGQRAAQTATVEQREALRLLSPGWAGV
jgi:DNA-binding PadR family transcriptional regulator